MHFIEEMLLNKLEVAEAMKILLLVFLFSRVPLRYEIHGISSRELIIELDLLVLNWILLADDFSQRWCRR